MKSLNRWVALCDRSPLSVSGFTLLEVTVIIAATGILVAIMAVGWTSLLTTQRLNAAQDIVHQALRDAQGYAKINHILWQSSFRELNGHVEWAIHPASLTPQPALWHPLDTGIQIDSETSLQQSGSLWKVQFDEQGNVNGQLGRITLSSKLGGSTKRCVIVSTLLGMIRKGQDHRTKQSGKYCY